MLKLRWLIIIALLVALLGTVVPAFAADTTVKENPQSAQEMFSSIALLNYYSSSLDYIIQLDQKGSDVNLAKMPFANVPQELNTATSNFASNGMEFTASLVKLFGLWNQQNRYIQQYRLVDAAALYTQIIDQLPAAQQQLSQIESSVTATGVYLNIGSLPSDSGLKLVYDEVVTKIQQLSNMLDVLSRSPSPAQLAASFKPTVLTLSIDPVTAYVGDAVTFTGTLSSQGAPLPARTITLLLNNSDLLTVQTDTHGQFQGTFRLPYLYINQMSVQAIYYPQGNDAGVYLAATSPVLTMTALFYAAQLTLQMNDPAHPGKETMLLGTFNYADGLILLQRKAELYLDNNLEEQFDVGPSFNKGILLDNLITPGKHIVTVSAPALGRFAPVTTSYVMEVTLATTVLDLNMPAIGFIPGNIQLSGKLYSSVGSLANATVSISEGKTTKQVITDNDGTFSTKIGIGLSLSLLGTQGITVQVQPQEPWNAPLTSTKNIFLINYVNLALLLIVLIALAVYLPRRFKKWFAVAPGKKTRLPELVPPVTSPAYHQKAALSPQSNDRYENKEAAANTILYWYQIALKLVENITKAMLKPHQTLREYGKETYLPLGPAGKYFMQLTYLLEKRLYGQHPTDASDIDKSQQLALEIQKQAGREP